ncbi:hypothetical protein IJG79_01270 [Candidatus Saccharibacteria bacterium]|nr:hypothetical protein [Candidatus Saccharibacteria bacterium]
MEKDTNPNGPAVSKRAKISKTQQETLLITIVASTLLGICGVLFVFFTKYINFNSKVIEAKDEAIVDYEKTIKNIGLCKDTNRDGKFSDDELKKCDPDSLDSSTMTGTLRYNVLVDMANNQELETVATSAQSGCFDSDNKKINWQEKFDSASSDESKAEALAMVKQCSSLRVIPDALPAQANELALMSSLNKLFLISNWEPESLSPSGTVAVEESGLSTIPVSLAVEAGTKTTMDVLNNIERSIRTFDIRNAVVSWSGNNFLSLKAQGVAYYTQNAGVVETKKTITAKDSRKRRN